MERLPNRERSCCRWADAGHRDVGRRVDAPILSCRSSRTHAAARLAPQFAAVLLGVCRTRAGFRCPADAHTCLVLDDPTGATPRHASRSTTWIERAAEKRECN